MGHYPVALDLTGRPVLVVGGGAVAERKVEGLLAAAAAVTVVSPELTPGLVALAAEGRIRHAPRPYQAGDLAGVELAFAATEDPLVNAAVAREGRQRRVWVNAADDPAHWLLVAVTTGGASPALARAVREQLEAVLTEDYAALVEIVGEVRRELRARPGAPDAEAWQRALGADLRQLVAAGRRDEARRLLRERLGAA
ncbi:MAG: bifunctional precorrin-2 dehydrogenase/sirohydrochlorin ferrochelatase [Candidatus Rokubacteria bacterium]|nr:bifunctional precorrin-2 dehydrogenase/sirohydrochlorin ferrochelatase [Candidatus Rokubacteria bacterium]